MSLLLSEDDLVQLTGKRRPSAQRRVLEHLGIPSKIRPDGTLVVLLAQVEPTQNVRPARHVPKLRLDG
jgi:Domain of unknown function (DUF4224)